MILNQKLNLVIPVEQSNGTTAYVHSVPISREVFERYHLVIAKTFARIFAMGLGEVAGPRVAALVMKSVAEELGQWDGPTGVEKGLIAEVRRLTNVIAPGGPIPMQEAVDKKFFTPDDQSEVENAIAFFTVACSMLRRAQLAVAQDGLVQLWGGLTTSLNCTEFAASLLTSTGTGVLKTQETASQVPY